jgi:hypothetical protein
MISILSFIIAGIFRFGNIPLFFEATQSTELIVVVLITSFPAFMLSKMYHQFIRRGYLKGLYYIVNYNIWLITFLCCIPRDKKRNVFVQIDFFILHPTQYHPDVSLASTVKDWSAHRKRTQSWKTVIVTDLESVESIISDVHRVNDWKNKGFSVFMQDGHPVPQESCKIMH